MDISPALATPFAERGLAADDQLAVEARNDPAAFALIYERHVERVFRFLRASGASEELAADLTATTFERALGHIGRYRPGDAGIAPWLLRIARNAYIDAARRRRPTVPLDEASQATDPARSPEDAAIAADERRTVVALLATLPAIQQEAIALRFAAGLSSREIAEVIGRSEDATKKLLTRALAALRETVSHDD
jgi:RNA polymerase sigma-70 factor (ECF subfamily)